MPEICRFHGIVIRMHFNEHAPPHFHAVSGGSHASFRIDPIEVIAGGLGRRQTEMIKRWAALHRDELEKNWQLARESGRLVPIEPLK